MKKIMAIVLVCICVLGSIGCNRQPEEPKGIQLLAEGNVINVDVSSLPKGRDYSFSGEDAKAIVDYLTNLSLESDFEENPDHYYGGTWVISLEYENGDTLTVYHFGKFIRSEENPWYKMTYEEADYFNTLLYELSH